MLRTGTIGKLASGEHDVSSAGLTIVADRAQVMDFSVPLEVEEITLIARAAKARVPNPTMYAGIFHYASWAHCIAAALAVGAGFAVMEHLGRIRGLCGDSDGVELLNGVALSAGLIIQRPFAVETMGMAAKVSDVELARQDFLHLNRFRLVRLLLHRSSTFSPP